MWVLTTDPRQVDTFTLTFVFLSISVELPCSQDKLAVVGLVLGFHPATLPGIWHKQERKGSAAQQSLTGPWSTTLMMHQCRCTGSGLRCRGQAAWCLMWGWKCEGEGTGQIKVKRVNSEWPEEGMSSRGRVGRQMLDDSWGWNGEDGEEGRRERGQRMNSAHVE